MKKTLVPPSIEWDFRSIPEESLENATLYEYARSCPPVRKAFCNWLDSIADNKPVRKHWEETIALEPDQKRKVSPEARDIIWRGLTIMRTSKLFETISEHRPDFPEPWGSVKAPRLKTSKILIRPIEHEYKKLIFLGKTTGDFEKQLQFQLNCCLQDKASQIDAPNWHQTTSRNIDPQFTLNIDWRNASIEDILSEFEIWLRREARFHAERKPAGKPHESEPLKWLSAFRLKESGLTYKDAQNQLRSARTKYSQFSVELPTYSTHPKWSEAIRCASKKITELSHELNG